jgi:hypothetical protein
VPGEQYPSRPQEIDVIGKVVFGHGVRVYDRRIRFIPGQLEAGRQIGKREDVVRVGLKRLAIHLDLAVWISGFFRDLGQNRPRFCVVRSHRDHHVS